MFDGLGCPLTPVGFLSQRPIHPGVEHTRSVPDDDTETCDSLTYVSVSPGRTEGVEESARTQGGVRWQHRYDTKDTSPDRTRPDDDGNGRNRRPSPTGSSGGSAWQGPNDGKVDVESVDKCCPGSCAAPGPCVSGRPDDPGSKGSDLLLGGVGTRVKRRDCLRTQTEKGLKTGEVPETLGRTGGESRTVSVPKRLGETPSTY